MKTLSLKLDDNIFNETEDVLARIKKSRNRYINEAVDYYNRVNRRAIIAKRLAKESRIVSRESLVVLNDLDNIPYED
jgi:metal-responsive CopG/Arc/MetJ family transcriptional regulator